MGQFDIAVELDESLDQLTEPHFAPLSGDVRP